MQALFVTTENQGYDACMQTGRPSKRPRTAFGERVHAAREALGFSQAQVAERLGITQTAYAVWERRPVALRPEQLLKLADILHVPIEELLGQHNGHKRSGGPVGKVRRVFEKVSQLPRYQQNKVVEFVEAFVERHAKAS